jgi:hypothetical protein
MSSGEDGYCSSDSPRAESPDQPQAAAAADADADAESPRAGAGPNKRDLHASSPAAKRRYGRGSSAAAVAGKGV